MIGIWIVLLAMVIMAIVFRPKESPFKSTDRVLIITAHPDDECMFFGPTILHLKMRNIPVKIICLSSGNYDGLGERRKKEFVKAVETYGAEGECVARFEDGPERWNRNEISDFVKTQVADFKASVIVTFDSYGVSGHVNHQSCSEIKKIEKVRVLYLESVHLLRKFSATCDLVVTSTSGLQYVVAGSWPSVKAMFCHRSQLVWYRLLYIAMSRYMTINSYRTRA